MRLRRRLPHSCLVPLGPNISDNPFNQGTKTGRGRSSSFHTLSGRQGTKKRHPMPWTALRVGKTTLKTSRGSIDIEGRRQGQKSTKKVTAREGGGEEKLRVGRAFFTFLPVPARS